jgi:hypothetical protein
MLYLSTVLQCSAGLQLTIVLQAGAFCRSLAPAEQLSSKLLEDRESTGLKGVEQVYWFCYCWCCCAAAAAGVPAHLHALLAGVSLLTLLQGVQQSRRESKCFVGSRVDVMQCNQL